MRDSQMTVGSVADVTANDGRGMQLYSSGTLVGGLSMLRLTAREAAHSPTSEQQLIDQVVNVCAVAGCGLPRQLIVNYYVSLKTNPLVVLAGAEGSGKVDFSRLFATAVLGSDSPQFVCIPSKSAWHTATGEGSYYRSLNDRFSSLRFIDLLHEAATPANVGKLYLVCFQRLHPSEIEPYMTSLMRVAADGQRYLAVPGVPIAKQPLIPPNVRISATVDTTNDLKSLSMAGLNAGVIDITTPAPHAAPAPYQLPPPGLQRSWLRSAIHAVGAAERKLQALGLRGIAEMTPAPAIRDASRRSGVAITDPILQELMLAVANSFDANGIGLFAPSSAQHNAQIAYDTQLIQRLRWRMNDGDCPTIAKYFGVEPMIRRVA